jgi:hypothetical protein
MVHVPNLTPGSANPTSGSSLGVGTASHSAVSRTLRRVACSSSLYSSASSSSSAAASSSPFRMETSSSEEDEPPSHSSLEVYCVLSPPSVVESPATDAAA